MRHFLLTLTLLLFPAIVSAKTILVLGDSLSAAYNMNTEASWVSLLQERVTPQHQLVNASISGDTSAGGLARLPNALRRHQPDIVILALGANDGLRALPLQQLEQNLARMIELSRQHGAKVLLAGMHLPPNYGAFYTEKFHQVYRNLATSHQVVLAPFLLDKVGGVVALTQTDGLHPTEEAQPIILENVWGYLEPLLAAD